MGTVGISATATGAVIDRYDQAIGGSVLAGGTATDNFTTPNINITTIYYAKARHIATGAVSATRTPVTATVNELPIISMPPVSQSICSGSTASLSVLASAGSGNIQSYQWKKNGIPTTEGSGYDAADYTTAALTSGATYTVTVTNSNGCEVTSGDAVVSINANPTISVQPATSQSICSGTTATLSVTAPGSDLSYRWNKNGSPTTEGSGYNTATYTTVAVTTQTTYSVMVTNSNGCSVTSNNAVVNINASPTINTQPAASTAICPGSTATLSVSATGIGLTYQWKKNGGNVSDGIGGTSDTYTTAALTTGATYTVPVTNSIGCSVTSDNAVVTADESGCYVTDCDGNTYRTKVYDGVEWMIDNSRKTCGVIGCSYPPVDDNGALYGLLYPWNCAHLACPDGWILPSGQDCYSSLGDALGDPDVVGNGWADWNSGYALAGLGDEYGISSRGERGLWWIRDGGGFAVFRVDSGFGYADMSLTSGYAVSVRCRKP
jgi:hypothetical protein